MKCSEINKDLVFYAEGSLSDERRTAVENHISECSACKEFLIFLNETFRHVEIEKKIVENPFFYTRVMLRLQKREIRNNPLLVRLIPNLIAAAVFTAAIVGGVNLGRLYSGNYEDNSVVMNEEIRFLDEIKQEPIESWFLTLNDDDNE
jgi:anti-sigma factor RsiW